jgi:hypothetical protein
MSSGSAPRHGTATCAGLTLSPLAVCFAWVGLRVLRVVRSGTRIAEPAVEVEDDAPPAGVTAIPEPVGRGITVA